MSGATKHEPGGATPLVGIVVVNWRSRGVTERCIASLARLSYPRHVLVLVDNGCEDFSAAEVEALLPGARRVGTPENLGFAGGANRGMREALRRGADYVWFLNSDTVPEPSALTELVAVAERRQSAIVGAKVLFLAEPGRIDSIALRVDLRRGRFLLVGHDEIDRGQYDHLAAVTAVTGCAMLVGRAACERLGGFDESFFSYLEDVDLCLRARREGLDVAAAPRARVLHDRTPAARGRQSASSLYYTARNHLRLIDRHGPRGKTARRFALACAVLWNVAFALRARERGRFLAAVRRGIVDYGHGIDGKET